MSERTGSVAVFAVGDELVAGELRDANGPWLAARLPAFDFHVVELHALPDDEEEIVAAIEEASHRRALIILTGGLGPTLDDITRHAVARAVGVELERDAATVAQLQRLWRDRGQEMPLSNERQALFPTGGVVLANSAGTAPGFRTSMGDCQIVSLPGPPREMQSTFEGSLAPWLAELPGAEFALSRGRLYLAGLSESRFADLLGERMARDANPRIGVLASLGVLTVKIEARGPDAQTASARLESCRIELEALFSEHSFGHETGDLAQVVGRELLRGGRTIATAESCTGGMIAARLTSVAGISAAFLEGFVTYSNAAKEARLGVPRELLLEHGAVSAEVAGAMARGAAERSGAEIAISTTGIAGPGGGTEEQPVGLCYFGIWAGGELRTHRSLFPPRGRDLVREFATNRALDLVRRALLR